MLAHSDHFVERAIQRLHKLLILSLFNAEIKQKSDAEGSCGGPIVDEFEISPLTG